MHELVPSISLLQPYERGGPETFSDSLKIVVADGSAEFRQAASELLQAFFEVEVVGAGKDGFEALQLTIAYAPDLLIMDANTPGIDGLRVATLVGQCCPATKVLLMSAHDSPQLRERCRVAGAHGFTSKQDLAGQFAQLCCEAS
jgi:DNA-binding NarL/FixJ family response regulator